MLAIGPINMRKCIMFKLMSMHVQSLPGNTILLCNPICQWRQALSVKVAKLSEPLVSVAIPE